MNLDKLVNKNRTPIMYTVIFLIIVMLLHVANSLFCDGKWNCGDPGTNNYYGN